MVAGLIVSAIMYLGPGAPLYHENVILDRPAVGQVVCMKNSFSWVFKNANPQTRIFCVDEEKNIVLDRVYQPGDISDT